MTITVFVKDFLNLAKGIWWNIFGSKHFTSNILYISGFSVIWRISTMACNPSIFSNHCMNEMRIWSIYLLYNNFLIIQVIIMYKHTVITEFSILSKSENSFIFFLNSKWTALKMWFIEIWIEISLTYITCTYYSARQTNNQAHEQEYFLEIHIMPQFISLICILFNL